MKISMPCPPPCSTTLLLPLLPLKPLAPFLHLRLHTHRHLLSLYRSKGLQLANRSTSPPPPPLVHLLLLASLRTFLTMISTFMHRALHNSKRHSHKRALLNLSTPSPWNALYLPILLLLLLNKRHRPPSMMTDGEKIRKTICRPFSLQAVKLLLSLHLVLHNVQATPNSLFPLICRRTLNPHQSRRIALPICLPPSPTLVLLRLLLKRRLLW